MSVGPEPGGPAERADTAAITLSICTYERYDVLPRAIASAISQNLSRISYRILVIDNSPDDAKALGWAQRYVGIENLHYHIEREPGLSNARNVAAALCGTKYVTFIDDDAVASANLLSEVLAAFNKFGPNAHVVGGRVDPIWAAARPAWLHDDLLGSLSVVNWGGTVRVAASTEWFAGTNISFLVQAITDAGGFSKALGRIGSGQTLLSNEETALLAQIGERGGLLIYAPKAIVAHQVEAYRLTRTWFRKRVAWQAASDFLMDPDAASRTIADQWEVLVGYFNALPPHERTIRGLRVAVDDPELFRWQLSAVYGLTLAALAGFDDLPVVD